jgi:hypothetical protein
MPRGSRHWETGLLLRGDLGLVLRLDGGGEWQLDAPGRAQRYIGQRVQIEGTRDGFNLLAVTKLEPLVQTRHHSPHKTALLKRIAQAIRNW